MVLGFGSRKKKGKEEERTVRMSPSLPEMKAQGVPWPSDLVDVNELSKQQRDSIQPPFHSAAKVSFSSENGTMPFHKPFRVFAHRSSNASEGGRGPGAIASLYMSHPPSAFNAAQDRTATQSVRTRHSQRRARIAPTFNLMVRLYAVCPCQFDFDIFFFMLYRSLARKARARYLSHHRPTRRQELIRSFHFRAHFFAFLSIPPTYLLVRRRSSGLPWTVSFETATSARNTSTPPVSRYANLVSIVFYSP